MGRRLSVWQLGCAAILVAAYMFVCYGAGEDSYVRIHDSLDSIVPAYRVLSQVDPPLGLGPSRVDQIQNGLPREFLYSEFDAELMVYHLVDPFLALVITETAIRFVALLGMALLLWKWVLPSADSLLIVGVALTFALLPFWVHAQMSIAAQPILLWALLAIWARQACGWHWLVVGLFPFVSHLVYVGFFIVPAMAMWFAVDGIRNRRLNLGLVFACLLLGAGYLASEHRLVQQLVFASVPTHRTEFSWRYTDSFRQVLTRAKDNFLYGREHASTKIYPFILVTVLLGLLRPRVSQAANGAASASLSKERRLLWIAVLLCAAISVYYGFTFWTATGEFVDFTGIGLLKGIDWSRLHWLHPLLWFMAFGLSLYCIQAQYQRGTVLVCVLLAAQIVTQVRAAERRRTEPGMTFREYYSTPLFEEIKQHIGNDPSEYRVASLGLEPDIALYNGFYCLDGYVATYPLEYKHRFREVIAAELERDPKKREYFDRWGCRYYLFSKELDKHPRHTKSHPIRVVDNLQIDTRLLAAMGCQYILSAVQIRNADSLGLQEEKTFHRDDSPWEIRLYRLTPADDNASDVRTE